MSCLGYALLHPLQVERTLTGSELTLALDDGIDVVLAGIGAGGLGAFAAEYEVEFGRQLDQIAAQFQALASPGGPFAGLASLGELLDGDFDLVAAVEQVADFLCDLQPAVISGLLGGLLDRLDGALPVLEPAELAARLRTLALAGLAALEAPLLSGRDDMAAHRGYRAAAAIRVRLDPVLDQLTDTFTRADVFVLVGSAVDELPQVDEAVVARLRAAGCLVRDRFLPFLRCAASISAAASGSVTAGGSVGQHPTVRLADDVRPAPHSTSHKLWYFDLATNVASLVLVIYESIRTQNPPDHRVAQFLFTDLLRPLWIAFRTVVRATRWEAVNGPDEPIPEPSDGQQFVWFLFGDFGDFVVQFLLEVAGSGHDMAQGWPNWISSIGLRLVKYYTFVVQPRTPYLFLRSLEWIRSWSRLQPTRYILDEDARKAALLQPGEDGFTSWPLVVGVGDASHSVGFGSDVETVEQVAALITAAAADVRAYVAHGELFIEVTGDQELRLEKTDGRFPPKQRAHRIPMERVAWLFYGPGAFASMIAGMIMGATLWEKFHIESAALAAPIVCGVVLQAASFFLMPLVRVDGYGLFGPGDVERSPWTAFAALFAAFAVIFIATQTFLEASPREGTLALAIILPVLFGGVAAIAGIGSAAGGIEGFGRAMFYVVMLLNGALMGGVLTAIVWWWVLTDGSDRKNVFDPLDKDTSPYRLPYPADEAWLCGQNSHGFFSHQMFDKDLTTRNFGNHFSYDLNEAHGSSVLAARTGLVGGHRDDIADGDPVDPNTLRIQHLDWVPDHDPGWDLERDVTYANNLHLANRGTHVHLHQLVRQGAHVADSDDTGTSAMNHLHWSANTGQSTMGLRNLPSMFREGKPNSLAYYRSTNTKLPDESVSPIEFDISLGSDGNPAHTHLARFERSHLEADGSIPASVTVVTDVGDSGPRHRHRLTLSSAQLVGLLRRQDPEDGPATTSTDGHTHTVTQFPNANDNAPGGTVTLDRPPPATLPARAAARVDDDYQLLGHQMVLRVNDRATEWHTFGNHRASVAGVLTLDRGPGRNATVRVRSDTTNADGTLTLDLMARAAAAAMSSAEVTVRAEPVLVLETRVRGSSARLQINSAPSNLTVLTSGLRRGSGTVPRLDQVTPTRLRSLINAALTQATPQPPSVAATIAAGALALAVGGNPVSTYAGSTDRIEEVMSLLGGSGTVVGHDPLPLTSGTLVLGTATDQLTVEVPGSPARIVMNGDARTAARLGDNEDAAAEPLMISVRDDAQAVQILAGETAPAAIARRINSEAEGVRAWVAGDDLIIETVAVGAAARLALTKGPPGSPGSFPAAIDGAAPVMNGIRMADSSAITQAELAEIVRSARAEAVRATSPARASISSGALVVAATPAAEVTLSGTQALMGVLGVTTATATPGVVAMSGTPVTLPSLPAEMDLLSPGWIDVAVAGSDTWRVDVTAEPARAELGASSLPRTGDTLDLDVNGTPVQVNFAAEHVTSLTAVAARIEERVAGTGGTQDGVVARIAYRYRFESARHGGRDLAVGPDPAVVASSPGSGSAGVATQLADTGRGRVADATAVGRVTLPVPSGTPNLLEPDATDGRLVRAFSATGSPVAFAATGGGGVQITAVDRLGGADVDPLGIVGNPAPSPAAGPFDLARESVGYVVAAGGTETEVELNAAPAHLHGSQALTRDRPRFDRIDPVPLTVTVTEPGGATTSATVDLRGISGATAAGFGVSAAARIQREAPHVRCWFTDNRLHVDTRGGGTGWRLRLEGELALLALGFPAGEIDDAGGIEAGGGGNVADGGAVTMDEVRDIFNTMGGLATLPPVEEYGVSRPFGAVRITAGQGAVSLSSTPPALAAALVTSPSPGSPGGVDIAIPAALSNGWLHVAVGGRHVGSGAVWGRRASVEAPDPLPADLTTVAGAGLTLTVDGGSPQSRTLPPGGFPSVDALVQYLNLNLGGDVAWIGVARRGTADHLRIASRTRGTSSRIDLACTVAVLGFPAGTTTSGGAGQINGAGAAADLAAVTSRELRDILAGGRNFSRAPQAAVEAAMVGGVLRLVATGGPTRELDDVANPHGLGGPIQATQDTLEYNFGAPLDTGPHLSEYDVEESTAGLPSFTRRMRTLLHAEPARIPPMAMPATVADLDGTTLQLTAGGVTSTITFDAVTAEIDVIDQIQRGAGHRVRASVVSGELRLESVVEGTAGALDVTTNPAVSTAFAHLGAPAGPATPGTGNVADVARVTDAEYEAIIDDGLLGADAPSDRTTTDLLQIGARRHLRLMSGRRGCDSALEVVPRDPGSSAFAAQLAAPPLDFELSLSRGPAIRASVTLPPFADGSGNTVDRNLNGDLWIRLNDNSTVPDLAPPTDVQVTFGGALSAAEAAAAIDVALGGAGVAVAFPDHSIVVESATPGLAGSVTIPAPGRPSTAAVLTALGIDGALTNRGWPGAGTSGRVGYRGHTGNALAGVRWVFSADFTVVDPATGASTPITLTTPPIAIAEGDTPSDAATAANTQLRISGLAGTRMGLAAVGDDGALYVELYGTTATDPLRVDESAGGTETPATKPGTGTDDFKGWLGGDVRPEHAFELRRTDVLRTFRMIYFDRRADGGAFIDPALFDPDPAPAAGSADQRIFDVGWVRPPADGNGVTASLNDWMQGRWLIAARAEGARSDTGPAGARVPAYGSAGEMIRSGGTAVIGGRTVHFPTQVRYWVSLAATTSAPLRVIRIGDEFLVDVLVL